MGFGGLRGRGRKKQDASIERDLTLSLEEIFHGCTKKMKISRRVSSIMLSIQMIFECLELISQVINAGLHQRLY